MGNPVPDSKTPALAAFGLVVIGLLIAALVQDGILRGSVAGGIIAGCGAIPAFYGMWKGIQQDTQTTLAVSVGAVLVSLAVGGLLIALRIFNLFL